MKLIDAEKLQPVRDEIMRLVPKQRDAAGDRSINVNDMDLLSILHLLDSAVAHADTLRASEMAVVEAAIAWQRVVNTPAGTNIPVPFEELNRFNESIYRLAAVREGRDHQPSFGGRGCDHWYAHGPHGSNPTCTRLFGHDGDHEGHVPFRWGTRLLESTQGEGD